MRKSTILLAISQMLILAACVETTDTTKPAPTADEAAILAVSRVGQNRIIVFFNEKLVPDADIEAMPGALCENYGKRAVSSEINPPHHAEKLPEGTMLQVIDCI